MNTYTFEVNGRTCRVEADPSMPLLWALRDRLALTGTKYGCGVGVCGACTIHHNGVAARSCQITVAAANGQRFTTIEGLSADASHPCQRAWIEEDVAQCGFCQPGMIMEAAALLATTSSPTSRQINEAFEQHICRCGTYTRIRAAIERTTRAGAAE
jgi:isoquinoline 1-oxidoreductase subunit alpha